MRIFQPTLQIALVALLALAARVLEAGEPLPDWVHYVRDGRDHSDHYGRFPTALGDVDGDGIGDFAVVGEEDASPIFERGRIEIISGARGELIRELRNPEILRFGVALASGGDIDGDGHHDLLVQGNLQLEVYSGADGDRLRIHTGPDIQFDRLALLIASDLDGDRRDDYLVGSTEETIDLRRITLGRVTAYSGADGDEIWTRGGNRSDDLFGTEIARLGDWTGDGVEDFAVAAPYPYWRSDHEGFGAGRCVVIDGRSGTSFEVIESASGDVSFGWPTSIADVDGDGRRELLIRSPGVPIYGQPGAGLIELFSSRDRSVLWSRRGQDFQGLSFSGDEFGVRAVEIGDVDGDGDPDLLVATLRTGILGLDSSRPYLLDGRSGAVLAVITTRADGGFGLHAGPLGDLDGDGRDEFLVANYYRNVPDKDSNTIQDAGRLYAMSLPETARFIRGELNGDGAVNLSDAIYLLNHLFRSGPPPGCLEAADVDRDHALTLSDGVDIILRLFSRYLAPAPPYPDCGGFLSLDEPVFACESSVCAAE